MDENNKYDPLECLEAEVKRFRETNTFNPLYVTGFYIQAGCVINEIKELRKENARLQAGWQPIETAPKDGTVIDVLAEHEGEHETNRIRLTNISWHNANEIFPRTGWIRITDDGNWDLVDSPPTCPMGLPQWTPTHWMPLPALPNAQAQR
jgi:hypothetical protein